VIFRLAEILRAKQLRQANDLRALLRRFADAVEGLRHIRGRIRPALHLDECDFCLV
jgi:hypothetical protein